MQLERSCLGRTFLIGCALLIVLALLGGGATLYFLSGSPEEPRDPTAEAVAGATTKREALERSLAEGRTFEAELSAEELTALARHYLRREGFDGDVQITLPGSDVEISFRTTTEQLKQLLRTAELPTRSGSEVRGSARLRLRVADGDAFAGVESLTLYGLPLPLSLLGVTAEDNLLDELGEEGQSVVRRIRSLAIRDETLFVATQ